jgi:Flp pilus assembly protein TadG
MRLIMKFLRNETGATAIEHGLIATKLNAKFTSIDSSLK